MNWSWIIFLLLIAFVPFFRGLIIFLFLLIAASIVLMIGNIVVSSFFQNRPRRNSRSPSRPSGDSSLFEDEAEDAEFKEKE